MPETGFAWRRPCPVCAGDEPRPLHANRMAAIDSLDMSYEVCRCGRCGFHYAAHLPLPETYDKYYRRLSKYDVPAAANEVPALDRIRFGAAVRLCQNHVPLDAAVADIGCGVGTLLHFFRMAGHARLFGLDPGPNSAERASERFGLNGVGTGSLQDAACALPLKDMGLVCLTGVLEHLPRLRDDMADLLSAMPPAARILVEVPCLERFPHDDAEPFGEFSLEHIQYFSESSLVSFMGGLGYAAIATDIVALDGATDSLFGLFARGTTSGIPEEKGCGAMDAYMSQSCSKLAAMLEHLARHATKPFLIYGAGSHTARLLPLLDEMGVLGHVEGIVDSNPNLVGKTMAGRIIESPESLGRYRHLPVMVSSYKGHAAIVRSLEEHHALIATKPPYPMS